MYDSPKTQIAPLKNASQSVYITDMNSVSPKQVLIFYIQYR